MNTRRLMYLCARGILAVLISAMAAAAQTTAPNQWTWMDGSSQPANGSGYPGIYGVQGTSTTADLPGSREYAVTWTDGGGNLWLFGGYGYDSAGGVYNLNDLWKFSPSQKQWTWVGGSSKVPAPPGVPGSYGTLGQAAPGNVPGGRKGAVGWTDNKGNLWLFGGNSDTGGLITDLNDLWEFNPSSSEWTWVGGSNTSAESGSYGAEGTPSSSNVPGGREYSAGWTDSTGKFWLFGGIGYDSAGVLCYLNDLWQFDPESQEWAWMNGSSAVPYASGQSGQCRTTGQHGVYGTMGTPAATNTPGSRANAVTWTDNSGNLWLFGGYGADANGAAGYLNDLWELNPADGEWTWMGGSSTLQGTGGVPGIYAAWMAFSASNSPGARDAAVSWTDASGNLWLFGGFGQDAVGTSGYLNDLWEFSVSRHQWAWMGGSDLVSPLIAQPGVYGTLGSPAFANSPGGREGALGWTDKSGNLWLMGGFANDYPLGPGLYQAEGFFNDLWEYQPNPGNLPSVATPSLSPDAGAYESGQQLTLADSTSGAAIYYFVNGQATPQQYTQPLTITGPEFVQAIGVAPGYADSAVASAAYTVASTAAPEFSPSPGDYSSTQTVTITSTTPGATIYYAINGVPSTSSTQYNSPLSVSSSETIEAIAVAPGFAESAVVSAAYTIWPASAVNQWAWMGGYTTPAVYGVTGVASPQNVPGGRAYSSTWTDAQGNLWLFGGTGIDVNGNDAAFMNDLWKFNPASSEWTWMGGNSSAGAVVSLLDTPSSCALGGCGQPGVYGSLGVAAAGNIPGGRMGAATWVDNQGNFWLFGGYGFDSVATLGYLNDLWRYNPGSNEWTWVGGSNVVGACFGDDIAGFYCGGSPGNYGTKGVASSATVPGGRYDATTWVDSSGDFWLFGGYQRNSAISFEGYPIQYDFSDLWKYTPSTNEWTWVSGHLPQDPGFCVSDGSYYYLCGQQGSYGAIVTSSISNLPGSRTSGAGWTDRNGNLWMLGGAAFDADGKYNPLNDVWEFSPSRGEWTWMGGSDLSPACAADFSDDCPYPNISPIYGSTGSLGVSAAGTIPGLTAASATWTDQNGNFWTYSGYKDEFFPGWNDMWELAPSVDEWTWMNGTAPAVFGVNPSFGTPGIPAAENNPGSRAGAATWTDKNGHLWLFGGEANPGGLGSYRNDLWEFVPSAPSPLQSFAVVAVPNGAPNAAQIIPAGTSSTITVNVVTADGFNSPVSLYAMNLPSGVTASFSPTTVSGTGSSQLTFTASMSTAAGQYTVTIVGSSGASTETSTVALTIGAAPVPTFTVSASQPSLTVNSGGTGLLNLTITPLYGFSSSVSFACSGLPSGASCTFTPATVTPSGSAINTQLSITISKQTSAYVPHPDIGTRLALAAGGIFVAFFGWKRRQRSYFLTLLAVTLSGSVMLCGCGGGGGPVTGSGGGGNGSTPVTSTIGITANSVQMVQTITISLTVN